MVAVGGRHNLAQNTTLQNHTNDRWLLMLWYRGFKEYLRFASVIYFILFYFAYCLRAKHINYAKILIYIKLLFVVGRSASVALSSDRFEFVTSTWHIVSVSIQCSEITRTILLGENTFLNYVWHITEYCSPKCYFEMWLCNISTTLVLHHSFYRRKVHTVYAQVYIQQSSF